jgi:hypothetical protein
MSLKVIGKVSRDKDEEYRVSVGETGDGKTTGKFILIGRWPKKPAEASATQKVSIGAKDARAVFAWFESALEELGQAGKDNGKWE